MPKVNWNDAEKREVVPDGKYLCRVKNVVLKTTKTGKDMWTVWLSIEDEGNYFGKILFHNLVFHPSSLWVIKQFYEAVKGQELTGEDNLQPSDLQDAYVIVTIKGKDDYGPIISYIESTTQRGEQKPLLTPKAPVGYGEVQEDDIPF